LTLEISERAFEDAIECALVQYGTDACASDVTAVREPTLAYGPNGRHGSIR
jgi:hypothetical protein